MKIPLAPADPLGEALHFLRMSGVMYCRSEFTAPWALSLPALEDCLMFHVVTSGRCVLEVKGSDDQVLQPGDFALVPHAFPGLPAGCRSTGQRETHRRKRLRLTCTLIRAVRNAGFLGPPRHERPVGLFKAACPNH